MAIGSVCYRYETSRHGTVMPKPHAAAFPARAKTLQRTDGGAAGFNFVGQWGSTSLCTRYSTGDCPVCQLLNESTVMCVESCA